MEESFPSDGGEAPIDLPASAAGGSSAPQARLPKEPQIEFLAQRPPPPWSGQLARPSGRLPGMRLPLSHSRHRRGPGGEPAGADGAAEFPRRRRDGQRDCEARPRGRRLGRRIRRHRGHCRCAERSRPRRPRVNNPPRRPGPSLGGTPDAALGDQSRAIPGRGTAHRRRSLAPQSFVKGLSRGSYAVFGVKADNGNWTVTVVRWDAIERVVLKDLKTLPA